MNSRIMRTIIEKGYYTMFEEIKRAINAADSIMQELRWSKDSAIKALDDYNNAGRELEEWEKENQDTLAIKIDMIYAIEKLLLKTMKEYF